MIIAAVVLIIAGLAVVVAAEATARGRLGVNGLIGIRIGYVMASDAAWLAGHKAARQVLETAGFVLVAAGVVALVSPLDQAGTELSVLVCCAAAVVLLVIGAVIATREAKRVYLDQTGGDDLR